MVEYSAGEISRAGEKFALKVDDDGNWLAKVAGRGLKQPTRTKLVAEIERTLRLERKAVHIPITVMEAKNSGHVILKHGVVTGVHSGSGNILIAWDQGGNGQLAGYGSDVMQRLSDEDEVKLRRLVKLSHDSASELREFTSRKQVYKGAKGLAEQVAALLAKDVS
jgi:hypothetical protein